MNTPSPRQSCSHRGRPARRGRAGARSAGTLALDGPSPASAFFNVLRFVASSSPRRGSPRRRRRGVGVQRGAIDATAKRRRGRAPRRRCASAEPRGLGQWLQAADEAGGRPRAPEGPRRARRNTSSSGSGQCVEVAAARVYRPGNLVVSAASLYCLADPTASSECPRPVLFTPPVRHRRDQCRTHRGARGRAGAVPAAVRVHGPGKSTSDGHPPLNHDLHAIGAIFAVFFCVARLVGAGPRRRSSDRDLGPVRAQHPPLAAHRKSARRWRTPQHTSSNAAWRRSGGRSVRARSARLRVAALDATRFHARGLAAAAAAAKARRRRVVDGGRDDGRRTAPWSRALAGEGGGFFGRGAGGGGFCCFF